MSISRTGSWNYFICTSSTHPANPVAGTLIFETDTNALQLYSGSAWVQVGPITAAWTAWTATIGTNGGGAVNAASQCFAYQRIGRSILWRGSITLAAAGNGNNDFVTFTWPGGVTPVGPWAGTGREGAIVGSAFEIIASATKGICITYNNGATNVNSWALQMGGVLETST